MSITPPGCWGIFVSRISWNTTPEKSCVTKTAQLNRFPLKSTCIKLERERTKMSLNDYMSEVLTKIKCEQKYASCLGGYNIWLLTYSTHDPTQVFVDFLFSYSLLPCITKPTRVTAKSASLIDNIFSNSVLYDGHAFTGNTCTDILDHFSFFYIDGTTQTNNPSLYFRKCTFSEQKIAQFSLILRDRNWSDF